MKKIILGLIIVLGLSFCVGGIVSASTMYSGITTRSGSSLYSGMSSTSAGCTDTDGGKDAYVRGTACIGGSCKIDGCYSQNRLREYYCGWGKVGYGYPQTETAEVILETGTTCVNGCKNGVCLRRPPIVFQEAGTGTEDYEGSTTDIQPVSGLQPAIDIVKQLIQDLNKLLGLLTSLSN